MNLRQLKIFQTVCETGSMSKTAVKLYMTQPAVSQTIINLEEKLGVKLFDRLNRDLVLTYAGRQLLYYSKKILILVKEAENTIEDISNLKKGHLRIGASMTIGTYLLPEIINSFKDNYQDVEISLVIDNTSVIEKMVLNNDIDIGMVEGPIKSEDIKVNFYYDDHLTVICSTSHKWSEKKEIEAIEIENENMIMREKGSGTRKIIEDILEVNNVNYSVGHILNNIEAIKKAVAAGLGISILPEVAIKQELADNELSKVGCKELSFSRKFNVIYHKDKYFSKIISEFINFL